MNEDESSRFVFVGTVYPPTGDLRGGHITTDSGIAAEVSIVGPRLVVTMSIPPTESSDPGVLRNSASVFVQNYLDAHAFTLGTNADHHIEAVLLPDGSSGTFDGMTDMGIEDADLREAVRRALSEGPDPHLRVALSDLNMAMRVGQDTPMHCYRAVESVRQHFASSPSDTKASWERMRQALGVSRSLLDDLAEAAKPRRHGEERRPIAGETRRDYISFARFVVWRYAVHLMRESGRDEQLRAVGSWEPKLTEPMARLQEPPSGE